MKRATRQRSAIRSVVEAAKRPLSVHEVLELARATVPSISVATIYRNLKLLLDDKELQAVTVPGGGNRYEVTTSRHHHHFLCKSCDRVYELFDCPGSLTHLAPRGFKVDDHDITLYGRCPDCESQRAKRREARARRQPRSSGS